MGKGVKAVPRKAAGQSVSETRQATKGEIGWTQKETGKGGRPSRSRPDRHQLEGQWVAKREHSEGSGGVGSHRDCCVEAMQCVPLSCT